MQKQENDRNTFCKSNEYQICIVPLKVESIQYEVYIQNLTTGRTMPKYDEIAETWREAERKISYYKNRIERRAL